MVSVTGVEWLIAPDVPVTIIVTVLGLFLVLEEPPPQPSVNNVSKPNSTIPPITNVVLLRFTVRF